MNKSTKIWLNYLIGGAISLILLLSIYRQVTKQMSGINADAWKQTGDAMYLWLCIGLMFVNTSLEGTKWYILTNLVEPVPYFKSFSSYLAGIAFSIITPNRIGEYPGRILYLGKRNTWRYINVSVPGVLSQLCGIYIFGSAALLYYGLIHPMALPPYLVKGAAALCIAVTVFIVIVYWRFERWLPVFGKIKWLKKFSVYGRLLSNISVKQRLAVLGISVLRTALFTAQYLFLLRWMHVEISMADGYFMAALFFWVLAIIPGVALIELGVRGSVSIYLFQQISATPTNTLGIIAATGGIWLLNLIVPSVAGSILIAKMRILT